LLPSVPGYVYAQKGNDVFVNLFMSSHATLSVQQKEVDIDQKNNYPWDGDLLFTVSPKKGNLNFGLKIRIPGWVANEAIPSDLYRFQQEVSSAVVITVNNVPMEYSMDKGYATIERNWKKGDVVKVTLPMAIRKVIAHQNLTESVGKVALQRGPLMYCAEWADNNGRATNLILPAGNSMYTMVWKADMLNGIMQISTKGLAVKMENNSIQTVDQTIVAIPYYAWANRGKGEMTVWLPEHITDIDLLTKPMPTNSK
jgi:DUF1680 family protein